MSIRKGEPWGGPEDSPPDLVVTGDDHDLAAAVAGAPPGVLVSFLAAPGSDVARAVGLRTGAPHQGVALPMDALALDDGTLAVNAVVLGRPPDRLRARDRSGAITLTLNGTEGGEGSGETIADATTLVVATGQWLRGADLVPRGHPGDGRAELQVYRLRRSERRAMRRRLPTGAHLPHPRIVTRTAVEVEARADRGFPLEIDGRPRPPAAALQVRLIPSRYRLLI